MNFCNASKIEIKLDFDLFRVEFYAGNLGIGTSTKSLYVLSSQNIQYTKVSFIHVLVY